MQNVKHIVSRKSIILTEQFITCRFQDKIKFSDVYPPALPFPCGTFYACGKAELLKMTLGFQCSGFQVSGNKAISGKENTADLTTFQKLSNLSGD